MRSLIYVKLFSLCFLMISCSTIDKKNMLSTERTKVESESLDCVQIDKLVRSPASGILCKDLFISGGNKSPQDFLNSFSQNSPQGEAILKRVTFKPKKIKAVGGKDVYVDNLGAYLVEQTLYIIREFAVETYSKSYYDQKPDLSYEAAQNNLSRLDRVAINLVDFEIKLDPLAHSIAKKFTELYLLKDPNLSLDLQMNANGEHPYNDSKIRTFVSKEIAKGLVLEKSYKPKDIVGFDGKKITSATYAEFVFEQSKFLFRDFLGDYLAGIMPPQEPRLPSAQAVFTTRFKDTTVNPVAYRFAYSRLMQLHESVISGKLKEEDLRKLDVAVFDSMLWTDILRLSAFQRP